jgi:hypothetical protein
VGTPSISAVTMAGSGLASLAMTSKLSSPVDQLVDE